MASPRLPDRHTVYLTNRTWKKLKERAILEDSSATSIVTYLIEEFFKAPHLYLPLSRYQRRLPEETTTRRQRCTIYMPDAAWKAITDFCSQHRMSVSGVIEYLLSQYLGLSTGGEEGSPAGVEQSQRPPSRVIFDAGDNPFYINLTRPKEEDAPPDDPSG